MFARNLAIVALWIVSSSLVARADDACAIKQFRWEEDCEALRQTQREGSDVLRYISLDATGSFWLTLGGEYRFKSESLDAPDFDVRASDKAFTALGQRFLAHADFRTAYGPRLFVQLSAAAETGRKPIERPFDRSSVDLAQAFVDLPLPFLDATVLRVGRQELDSGGNRLISTRDTANLRRAFDMVHLESDFGSFRFVGFYGRPVQNRIGPFDDRGDPTEAFYGGWLTASWTAAATAPSVSLFVLARDRKRAIYQDGAASDQRRTIGARVTGRDQELDYAFQAAGQLGSFGNRAIRAFGLAGDVGWHPHWPTDPRLAISFGYASGDARPGDKTLGTFDVLYPNLGYFTDAPVYYPGNTADFQPNVTVNLPGGASVRAGSDVIFRISRRDAVYAPPGIPLIRGDGTGPSFVAALSYLRADWPISANVLLTVSAVHGSTGDVVRRAGGRDFNYGALTIDLHV